VPEIPIDDVAYFSLYLRLQDGFSTGTADQVKLISMRGAVDIERSYGGAGRRPRESGTDGFAADLCIDNSRSLHFYYYHLDQRGDMVTLLPANCLFSEAPKFLRGSGIVWN